MSKTTGERPKSRRGFAAMHPDQQRELASKGGRRAHELKVAHRWTSEEAAAAARKGGALHGKRGRDRRKGDGE